MLVHFGQVKKGKLQPGQKTDRAVMWQKGRKKKDGTFDEEVQELNAKIVSVFFFLFMVLLFSFSGI